MTPWFGRRQNATRFLILFPGRTGSSWLVDGLSRHPSVRVEGEVLVGRSASEQSELFDRLLGTRAGNKASGFKTKMKDVADDDLLRRCILDHDVLVILMRRADLLRLALSRINARRLYEATGAWNVRAGRSPMGDAEISVEELDAALAECEEEVRSLDSFVSSLEVEPKVIEYASIIDSPESVLDAVQEWIGVKVRSLAPAVVKNTSQDLTRAVSNFDRLREEMSTGRWERIFDVDPFRETSSSIGR